jgi:hypothetical protein
LLGCHSIFDYSTVKEMNSAIRVFGKTGVVRDHADGRSTLV